MRPRAAIHLDTAIYDRVQAQQLVQVAANLPDVL
ncbi:hypothetical protein DEMA109039_07130 [Deinococcus marmoris]